MHVSVAGEVRFLTRSEDGVIKNDTGFQKNLILNQGLDFFGGAKGRDIFERCLIGSGNSLPTSNQVALDAPIAIATGTFNSNKYDYNDVGDNTYKVNRVFKYTFSGLDNVNITEVGLASQGTSITDYYLCTRALIKDSAGTPTAVTIQSGEVLEVYYKVWQVFSTLQSSYAVPMLDGDGGSVPYNVTVRPAIIGKADNYSAVAGKPIVINIATNYCYIYPTEIADIFNEPSGSNIKTSAFSTPPYITGSYKAVWTISFKITDVMSIRSVVFGTKNDGGMGVYQIRYGSVSDDSPIPKTNKETLSMPFEVSWGRYEGAL